MKSTGSRTLWLVLFGILGFWFMLGCHKQSSSTSASTGGSIHPYTAEMEKDDGQWVRATKDFANTRYSSLSQITAQNVAQLRVSWTFATTVPHGQEAAPIVANNTMYLATPWPNVLYALDLTKPGAPLKWKYEPHPSPAAKGEACCDWVTRGAVFDNGKLFFNTLDGYTIALNADTGEQLWRTHLADLNNGETITMAPMVVRNHVFVGNSGGEFGVRGWLAALDTSSGKLAWKAYSTGPDNEVLIGSRFHPYYATDKGSDLGVKTWPPDAWRIGGGTVWGFLSYDPQLNLIYYGTANPGPWNPEVRPGDNKWTAGMFARDPDTGEAVWFYQMSPHDLFDWDGINEDVLVDLPWQGQLRKVLLRPDRNGHVYVIDRATGQVLSANPFAYTNTTTGVDLRTGALQRIPDKAPRTGQVVRNICPDAPGAKDWQPSSFSPQTGLLYIPHQNMCMDEEGTEVSYIAGTPYVGSSVQYYAGPGGHMGELTAWDPIAGKAVWTIKDKYPIWSGTVTTAGGLVFFGTMDGWFKAADAKTGNILWQFKTDSGIIGQPVSYRGPDGKQYIAILSGIGGWPGSIVAGQLDTRDGTAANGWGKALPNIRNEVTAGGTLYVFSLP
ncbi:PQQ-dependent dehydrogenase, methanol/ethanol family [Terriglobus albidus]|uniref:PQQ-dependent dehydrogenase, methanol/ethanol family n=1 Tax=Terriglobus albidus TaxID=1592106 RepID=UPI0021E04847|nr:PQQ-dependent dehydrogenase, methanol/ethanol family [Terriglobus albidus]